MDLQSAVDNIKLFITCETYSSKNITNIEEWFEVSDVENTLKALNQNITSFTTTTFEIKYITIDDITIKCVLTLGLVPILAE